jgi:L-malate glycosyltransferase
MHILLVPSEYPTKDHKLGGIFTMEQQMYLKKNNSIGLIYIYLFSIRKILTSLFFKIFTCEKNYRNFIFYFPRVPYFKNINYKIHYFFFLIYFKKYIKIYGKPDLLHIHFSEFSIWTAYKIKQKYKIPYIVTEHSTDFLDGKYERNYPKNSKVFLNISKAFRSSKKVICVSSILKKKVKKYFKLKKNLVIVIPNLSISIKFKKYKQKNSIIFVGSFEERKNPLLLLKSFKKIYKKNLKLNLVGNGPLKSKIDSFVKNNDLQKNVKIFTTLNRKNVLKLINQSSILVLPSNFETFGVVVIEAYSMGVPVVMTDSLGVRDLYNSNCSLLIKKNSPTALIKAILKILGNKKKYKPNKIINFYKKKFSPEIVTKKIQLVYNS